ncbi:MAG: carbohydrate-binding protein [Planctomycetes bacterium]|nr:carbohydrate-binding protein [Planctomycetota bacterium]
MKIALPLTVLSLWACSRLVQAEEPFNPARLSISVYETGIPQPMELEVGSDGRIFYMELGGKFKIYKPDTHASVEAADFKVFTGIECGLLGFALDPHFDDNHWVYIHYSPTDYDGQYISRFTMNGDTLDMTSEKRLLIFHEQRQQCCHHAGSMEFGPDGCLYIGAGDNTNPFNDSAGYAPIDERKGREPWDAQGTSGNTNDLRGKIMRIRPLPDGTYEIPDGNLFPKDGSKGKPEIYVMGCRNPWRLNVDQKTGYLYWGEVGPDAGGDNKDRGPRGYDEVNQARHAGNFGWPYFVGPNLPYRHWDFEKHEAGITYDPAHPINESPNNTGERELPPAQPAFIWYPGGGSSDFPVLGSGGRTACAGPVYHYDPNLKSETKFPEHFDNCLFIYDWSRHWIMAVHLDADSNIKEIEPFMPTTKFKRPVDLCFGPEGALYMLEYGETWGPNKDSKLERIDYIRGNRTPIASAKATNNIGKTPLTVTLSAEGTTDADADPLTYQWLRTDNGQTVDGMNATMTFDKPGVYNVQLVVKDPNGGVSLATVPVMAGNSRPTVAFVEPQDGDFFEFDKPIHYRVDVKDEEDNVSQGATIALAGHANSGNADEADVPAALKMMQHSDCFNCHAVDHKIIGPAYMDVARKYQNDAAAQHMAAMRVVSGSGGVWGKDAIMLPHPQHTQAETTQMVEWIMTLANQAGDVADASPLEGEFHIGTHPKNIVEGYTLSATYTDKGFGPVGPLTGSAKVTLRPNPMEAEAFDTHAGLQVLGTGDGGSGQQMLGGINSGSHASYRNLSLAGIHHITCRVASAGRGGTITLRKGAIDGEALAAIDVTPTGGWDKFVDLHADIKDPGGRFELFVVFTHPQGGGGLMNLNWIRFEK